MLSCVKHYSLHMLFCLLYQEKGDRLSLTMNSEDGVTVPPVWHTNGGLPVAYTPSEDGDMAQPTRHTNGGLSVAYTPSENGETASQARHTNGSLSVAYTPKSVSQVSKET